jgi:hypothetical protein
MWRIFSMRPLYATLAAGKVWRWFALNIPMDLMTGGGKFTSDIDIIAKVHDFPNSKAWLYKTWEVKVSLLCRDGTARSLKSGKTGRTVTQLKAYREFGSPEVSLLDCYICENGFVSRNQFPPPTLLPTLTDKTEVLRRERFGYQLLPFEHDRDADGDFGLYAYGNPRNPLQLTVNLVPVTAARPEQPFSRLADRLSDFFENLGERPRKSLRQIVFCRDCRRLQLIEARTDECCPECHSNLITQ